MSEEGERGGEEIDKKLCGETGKKEMSFTFSYFFWPEFHLPNILHAACFSLEKDKYWDGNGSTGTEHLYSKFIYTFHSSSCVILFGQLYIFIGSTQE